MPIWKRLMGVFSSRKKVRERPSAQVRNAPSSGGRRDPKNSIIRRIGLAFSRGSSSRAEFEGPEGFDLLEIEKAYNTEAYVRQAIDKYIDLMFKAGWDIVGKNQNAVDYVKLRLAAIAEATKTPTKQLLIEIAEDLVLYHNAFLIKARQRGGSYTFPPGINAQGVGGMDPVVGYFTLPVTTIEIARDSHGTVRRYKQEIGGSERPLEIRPENVVHMFIDKPKGRAYGVPFLWQALDDIKLLRQVEELVARLIYKDIFPLYQYQVGLPKEGYEATDDEIDELREQIGELTIDGGIVVPERHNITTIGVKGKALDVSNYLKYFEQRVFTGLGVSETMMGRGDTTNRSTADNMTTEMHDRIKAYQTQMAMFIDEFIFNELLREGGFDPLLRPEDMVSFKFKEIDIENKIKTENQAIQKFTNNAITHEELRLELGMDPVTDEGRLYFNMISTADAQAAANQADNKARPENQSGKKQAPGKKESISESLNTNIPHIELSDNLTRYWNLAREDVISVIKKHYNLKDKKSSDEEPKEAKGVLTLVKQSMDSTLDKHLSSSFSYGMKKAIKEAPNYKKGSLNYTSCVKEASDKAKAHVSKLIDEDLTRLILKALESSDSKEAIAKVVGAFSALTYRLKFIARSEAYRSYNYGFARTAIALGYKYATVSKEDTQCEACSKIADTEIDLSEGIENIPPFHANCTCELTLIKTEGKEGTR